MSYLLPVGHILCFFYLNKQDENIQLGGGSYEVETLYKGCVSFTLCNTNANYYTYFSNR